jgi:hypothetical protein
LDRPEMLGWDGVGEDGTGDNWGVGLNDSKGSAGGEAEGVDGGKG